MDNDDANEGGDSKGNNDEDLEVLRHSLDESQRSDDGAKSSSGGHVACTIEEARPHRSVRLHRRCESRVRSVLVPLVMVVKGFRPWS